MNTVYPEHGKRNFVEEMTGYISPRFIYEYGGSIAPFRVRPTWAGAIRHLGRLGPCFCLPPPPPPPPPLIFDHLKNELC